jgi:RNA recognition motif-containing protein
MKLFVGNLSFQTVEEDLRELFGSFGDIDDISVVEDRQTGRSRGFAFVSFADKDAAETAAKELDGTDFMGRNLKVNEATPKPQGGGGGGRSGGGGGGGGKWGGGGGGRSGGGGGGGRDRRPSRY